NLEALMMDPDIASAIGSFLPSILSANGAGLFTALNGLLNSGSLMNLDPAQQQAVTGLVTALAQNATATIQNTQQILELNGQMQEFSISSTEFERYRASLFTGLGKLVPGVPLPAMADGGFVVDSGAVYLHENEGVVPAEIMRGWRGSMGPAEEHYHMQLDKKTEVFDPVHAESRFAFEFKRRGG